MLLPNMTWDEVFREVRNDFLNVKINLLVNRQRNENYLEKFREKIFTTVSEIKSSRFNDWCVVYRKTGKDLHTSFYVKSFDKVGVVAFSLLTLKDQDYVLKFNSHFVKRYRERMKIAEHDPSLVFKHFFCNNKSVNVACYKIINQRKQAAAILFEEGMGFGIFHSTKNIFEVKTFLPRKLFNKKQVVLFNVLFTLNKKKK